MKIRSGFVSNSSSSSFICSVCGTAESGMDMSASDFEMSTCVNGHTFCDCHAKNLSDPSPEELRNLISERIKDMTWLDEARRKSKSEDLADVADDDLQEYYDDNYSDDGVPDAQCPVCSFSSLTDTDGFAYLKKKFNLTDENILNEIKADFKTYKEFNDTIFKKK